MLGDESRGSWARFAHLSKTANAYLQMPCKFDYSADYIFISIEIIGPIAVSLKMESCSCIC